MKTGKEYNRDLSAAYNIGARTSARNLAIAKVCLLMYYFDFYTYPIRGDVIII
ncbi:hypothetical protein [Nostoc sp. DSM 114161]|uniref:hypothetical protein n=1 Tax=Nostoc sp. DSM 114161 TaxID=3440143 RepID=UPI0040455833